MQKGPQHKHCATPCPSHLEPVQDVVGVKRAVKEREDLPSRLEERRKDHGNWDAEERRGAASAVGIVKRKVQMVAR